MYTQAVALQPGDPKRRVSDMGAAERAAKKDLAALPSQFRNSAIAAAILLLAYRLDQGMSGRDVATVSREMRLAFEALYELAPAHQVADPLDELQAKREKRMTAPDVAADQNKV